MVFNYTEDVTWNNSLRFVHWQKHQLSELQSGENHYLLKEKQHCLNHLAHLNRVNKWSDSPSVFLKEKNKRQELFNVWDCKLGYYNQQENFSVFALFILFSFNLFGSML